MVNLARESGEAQASTTRGRLTPNKECTENKIKNKNIISTCSYNAPLLSCTYTNADGILNKRTEFTSRVSGDIIGLTEVNPKNAKLGIQSAELSLDNYQCTSVYIHQKAEEHR